MGSPEDGVPEYPRIPGIDPEPTVQQPKKRMTGAEVRAELARRRALSAA